MDSLRWILLVAGIFFVLIIYFVGRKSRQQDSIYDAGEDIGDDIPDISSDDWRDSDEGIGQVRIVASKENDEYDRDDGLSLPSKSDADVESVDAVEEQSSNESVIVLHLLAKSPERLAGDKINSAAQANGLKFGDMNIFHRIDNGNSMFSMANMMEPGDFDPVTMHDLSTPGLTMFMQKSSSGSNLTVFEDMLECAYHMSEMLGAQLCNQQRQPLTQTHAEYYRELATSFDE